MENFKPFKNFSTDAIHHGQNSDQWNSGAVIPPISLSTTFKQSEPGIAPQFDYARSGNPTRDCLERCLAKLENCKYGLVFASGCACTLNITHLLSAGDHVVSMDDLYGGTNRYFRKIASRFGLEFEFVDCTNIKLVKAAMKPNTKMVWLETPTNPTMKIVDIKAVCDLVKASHPDCIVVVDNTFMSSYFQRPCDLGADITYHSLTKYMNGHSDVVMGSLTTNNEDLYEKLKYMQNAMGAIPSPFDSFLVSRGLKTLSLRMRQHMNSGLAVARFLEKHPLVTKVIHPGLESHPQHEVAKRQMCGYSGMVAMYIKGGLAESTRFLKGLKIFILAESLGGFESLAELPSVMTHASVSPEEREVLGISDSMIRLSVGLEEVDDLINDLDQALRSALIQMGQGEKPRTEDSSTRLPARPPRPNFEDLTPEEVEKMNEVIRKLEVMDRQENDKIRIMRESIQRFEERQKRQLSERNRFLASTNYLCRLCFKTKFVEKTARVCSSCGFKICSRCGLYTHDLVGGKQEMVRWRCRLCQLKREYACRTGQWYHGDAAQPVLEKHDLWLAVQKTRNGSESSMDGRRASDPAMTASMSMSRGRPVSDISINHGARNPRDLTYFTRARGTMVPPRHPRDMTRPSNHGPPPPMGLQRPRANTVGKLQRRAMQEMKPHFQSLPNKFDPHLPRSPLRDGNTRTPALDGSRESFRSDDSVFLVGSLNASKPLAQSSPNISEIDFDPRGSREPPHRGSKESVNSRRGRGPCKMKVVGRKVRSHSLSREQAISDAEDAGLSSSLSVSELIAISGNGDWRAEHASGLARSEKSVDSEKSFETDSSFNDLLTQADDSSRDVEAGTDDRTPARLTPMRPGSLPGSPVPCRRSEAGEEISRKQHKHEELGPRLDDTDGRSVDRSDSTKSRRRTKMPVAESFDSDDYEYDIPYSPTRSQPVIQGWKRYPSTDDKIVFGSRNSKHERKPLFIKKRNESVESSPVLTRIEWTPHRRRSCEIGASPLLRHMRMRNASSCERMSMSSVDESGSSVTQDSADAMEPITAHSQPMFNVILEAEDDESCISNFHRFGFRVAGGTINDDELIAVVSQVSSNYPAKIQGHLDKGDEILTWNGQDLTQKSFEEVLQVVDAPVSTVTLNVRRRSATTPLDLENEMSFDDKLQDSDLSALIDENHSDSEDLQHLMSRDEEDEFSESVQNAAVQEVRNISREGSVRKKWKSLTGKGVRRKSGSDKTETRRSSQPSVVSMVGGKVEAVVQRQPETKSIEVSLLGLHGLAHRCKDSHRAPNAVVLIRLLPRNESSKAHQIEPKLSSTVSVFSDHVQFDDVTEWQLRNGTVEVTVWDAQDDNHFEFLGEVLIDVVDLADREGKPVWFPLHDHDENSTLLEKPAPVVTSAPVIVLDDLVSDTSSTGKSLSLGGSPSTPRIHRLSRGDGIGGDSSFRSKMKKKMTTAMGKLSVGGDAKREQLPSDGNLRKSLTPTDLEPVKKSPLARLRKNNTSPSIVVTEESPSDDKSDYQFGRGSVNNSVEDLDDIDTDSEAGDKTSYPFEQCNGNGETERPTPEGDDITNLGPGQVCPRQGIDSPSNGDLKLGIIMTKGQLEVHIMSARGLPIGANGQPPDTYVKTYLTDSSKKRTQKKKTNIVKASCEPMYRQKTKYSACNAYRRQIMASVWERSAVFDKNQSIGEVIIDLDDMDLSAMNTSWYRLYKRHTSGADSDSDTMNTY